MTQENAKREWIENWVNLMMIKNQIKRDENSPW